MSKVNHVPKVPVVVVEYRRVNPGERYVVFSASTGEFDRIQTCGHRTKNPYWVVFDWPFVWKHLTYKCGVWTLHRDKPCKVKGDYCAVGPHVEIVPESLGLVLPKEDYICCS